MQRHPGRDLEPDLLERRTVGQLRVGRVDDDHARRLEPRGRHRGQTAGGEDRAHPLAEFELRRLELVEAALLGLAHERGIVGERIRRHRRVIRRATGLVLVGDEQPLLQIHREARRGAGLDRGPTGLPEHDVARARRTAPPLLRGADEDVDAEIGHRHPHRTRGDAIEDEDSPDGVDGIGDGPDVLVRQEHPRGRLDVGSEHDGRTFALDGGDHLGDGGRRPRGPDIVGVRLSREDDGLARDRSGVEDLRPPEREEPVADDQALLSRRDLPGHRFHRIGPATGDDGGTLRVVGGPQDAVDVLHDGDEARRHVVERTVGEDDRVLEQTAGIDVVVGQGRIVGLRRIMWLSHRSHSATFPAPGPPAAQTSTSLRSPDHSVWKTPGRSTRPYVCEPKKSRWAWMIAAEDRGVRRPST